MGARWSVRVGEEEGVFYNYSCSGLGFEKETEEGDEEEKEGGDGGGGGDGAEGEMRW